MVVLDSWMAPLCPRSGAVVGEAWSEAALERNGVSHRSRGSACVSVHGSEAVGPHRCQHGRSVATGADE